MLFKDLLEVLVTVKCYTIRIDLYDWDTEKTIYKHVYSMDSIPNDYLNLKVLVIHPRDLFNINHYEYYVTVYK